MGTRLLLETDVSGALRSCFSFSYGLPVSERSAAACEDKKLNCPGKSLFSMIFATASRLQASLRRVVFFRVVLGIRSMMYRPWKSCRTFRTRSLTMLQLQATMLEEERLGWIWRDPDQNLEGKVVAKRFRL